MRGDYVAQKMGFAERLPKVRPTLEHILFQEEYHERSNNLEFEEDLVAVNVQ